MQPPNRKPGDLGKVSEFTRLASRRPAITANYAAAVTSELDKLIFDIAAAKELVTVNKGYDGTTYGPSVWDLKILDLLLLRCNNIPTVDDTVPTQLRSSAEHL